MPEVKADDSSLDPPSSGDDAVATEEDGWGYWMQVYDDPVKRQGIHAIDSDSPRLAEILSGERLRRTVVAVQNYPPGVSLTKWQNLFQTKLGAASVLDISFKQDNNLMVRFYEADLALAAVEKFNGFCYFGKHLVVRLAQHGDDSDGETTQDTIAMTTTTTMRSSLPATKKVDLPKLPTVSVVRLTGATSAMNIGQRPTRPPATIMASAARTIARRPLSLTMHSSVDLVRQLPPADAITLQLIRVIGDAGGIIRFDDVRVHRIIESATAAGKGWEFLCWNLGAFRCSPHFELVGRHLALKQHKEAALELCRRSGEPLAHRDIWEPVAPFRISNQQELLRYLECMVLHFGPLTTTRGGDRRWWYLRCCLPPGARAIVGDHVGAMINQAPDTDLVVVRAVLYSSKLVQHRMMAADGIRRWRRAAMAPSHHRRF